MPSEERVARMRRVLERRQLDLEAVLEGVHDPHNASAVVRSCDGFGAGAVSLVYPPGEFPTISKTTSSYTKRWTTFRHYESADSCVAALHERGLRVIVTHIDDSATPYLDVDWTQPVAVVFGNERLGCSPRMVELADERVYIPMRGFAQSFNISVAAAIVLGEAARQREAVGAYAPTWSDDRQALLDAWVEREIRRELRLD